jgi:phosphonate transport system permease protein
MNRGILRMIILISVLLLLCILVLNDLVQGDWGNLSRGMENLIHFWNDSLWPPDWSMLQAQTYPECKVSIGFFCSKAYLGMMETIKMAFVATVFGFIGAISLSTMAAKNLVPSYVYFPVRIILAITRSLPSIIWAIIFVVVFGLGPLAGVLAMTFYTIGYLGKLQYEELEGMHREPLDAARAMGLSHSEIVTNVVIPESSNTLLSQLLFMFEYNVRHGTVLGLVGAGGIGYYLHYYMELFLYQKVMAFLVVIFVVVIIIDLFSMFVRSFVTDEGDINKQYWFSVFFPPSWAEKYHKDPSKEKE